MAKARSKKPDPPPTRGGTRRLVQTALVLLLAVGFVAGLIWLGRWGLEQLRGQDRYLVDVGEIEVEPPAGLERAEFLGQVQYESRLSAKLDLLDEELPLKLRDAFAKHPWVEKVDAVRPEPPRRIAVKLTYRTPALAVKTDGGLRAVDGAGVLLPKNAPTRDLPMYDGDAPPPKGAPGTRWGDPNVEQAARKAKG